MSRGFSSSNALCPAEAAPKLATAPRQAGRSQGATDAPQRGRAPAPCLWLIPAATWLSNVAQVTTGVVFRGPGWPGSLEDVASLLGFCPRAHKCPRGAEELTETRPRASGSAPPQPFISSSETINQKKKENCPRNVLAPWADRGHCHRAPHTVIEKARPGGGSADPPQMPFFWCFQWVPEVSDNVPSWKRRFNIAKVL